jgi:hypothetical protein
MTRRNVRIVFVITEDTPWIVYVMLAVLLPLSFLTLASLIGALKTAPPGVRKLERKFSPY